MSNLLTAIYVEDEDDWRKNVESFITKNSTTKFRRFITGSSLKDVEKEMKQVAGPTVIIMDLRLGNDTANYEGYLWLLDNLNIYLGENASTIVFVISGQLHEGIRETLVQRGISRRHIFDKGSWAEDRKAFVEALDEAASHIDDVAAENISQRTGSKSIDPYLIHSFRTLDHQDTQERQSEVNVESSKLPMVVRTRKDSWDYSGVPDLEVLGHINNIFMCRGSLRTMIALERDPNVVDVEASRPGMAPECYTSVPFIKADAIHHGLNETGDKCLIAFIDSGIDVLHEAFRDSSQSQSRILAVWDQRDSSGTPPPGFLFGTLHTKAHIDTYIETGKVPPNLVPEENDHGTHVVSIAAGKATPSSPCGVAPDAKIVVVVPDMSFAPNRPRSLGYSNSHLLALEFIKKFAEDIDLPVVINVSQGMSAGAHDGTSNLEKGFDSITDNGRIPGIVVVKSAGNERNASGHAMIEVASNSSEVLKWESRDVSRFMDVLELWFKAYDRYRFRVIDPWGNITGWVHLNNIVSEGVFPSGNQYILTYTKYDPDNGDSRFLLTIGAGTAANIVTGEWSLEIEAELIKGSGEIHAWLERNNVRPTAFINHVSEKVTLSIPGTANYVITVGSVTSTQPSRIAAYSSHGPTRDGRHKPDIAAPGEDIIAAQSGSNNGVMTSSGTSMAAPHVSGAIALLLSHWHKKQSNGHQQLNAAQVQAIITTTSQSINHAWHPGMGFGIVNVEALISDS